jgi:hypothetical protein
VNFQPIPQGPKRLVIAMYRHCGEMSDLPFNRPPLIFLSAVSGGDFNFSQNLIFSIVPAFTE